MIPVLLLKDLRRARRNPVPYLIHICVPLVITALLGLVFAGGGRGEGTGLGRIRVAVVDEDDSMATRMLRGALSQADAARHLEAEFLPRDAAMDRVTNNRVAAVLILPRGFTSDLLSGQTRVRIELVKNPAQQFHPAVVEELLGVVTTGLNAVMRNFGPDLAEWRLLVTGKERPSARQIASLVESTGERLNLARRRLDPIPVWYDKGEEIPAGHTNAAGSGRSPARGAGSGIGPGMNLFAYMLPGLAAMFLFFVGDAAMRDLHVEVRNRTLRRYCTFPSSLFGFVLAKVLFVYLIVVFAAVILLGLGPWIFGFRWERPGVVAVLTLGLGLFATGLMSGLAALVGGGRRAEVLTNMAGMLLGFGSGCAFPAESLPPMLRVHVTPYLPPRWFIEAMHGAQFGGAGSETWGGTAAGLAAMGVILAAFAAWRLRRGLEQGG